MIWEGTLLGLPALWCVNLADLKALLMCTHVLGQMEGVSNFLVEVLQYLILTTDPFADPLTDPFAWLLL